MIDNTKNMMRGAIDAYKVEIASLRTGRAHAGLLDKVMVEYYGTQTPLKQMATINVTDASMLQVVPWDKGAIEIVIKAIQSSDLGLTATSGGDSVRVPIPQLTEERRKELVKHLKAEAEKSKIGIRNIRRNAISEIKAETKEKLISEDEERRLSADVQKVTDQMIAEIDQLTQDKEKELMTV